MLYTLRFFSSKCSLFHNANLFGSCIIHVLFTGCAEIKKNNSGAKGLITQKLGTKPQNIFSPPIPVSYTPITQKVNTFMNISINFVMLRTLIALESNTPSVITLKPDTVHQLVENIYNFIMSFLNDHAVGEVRLSVALIDPKQRLPVRLPSFNLLHILAAILGY